MAVKNQLWNGGHYIGPIGNPSGFPEGTPAMKQNPGGNEPIPELRHANAKRMLL